MRLKPETAEAQGWGRDEKGSGRIMGYPLEGLFYKYRPSY